MTHTLHTSNAARWRKSSFSGQGACVEVARLDDGTVAVRNSNRPEAGTVAFPPGQMNAFLRSVKGGELDDLTR